VFSKNSLNKRYSHMSKLPKAVFIDVEQLHLGEGPVTVPLI